MLTSHLQLHCSLSEYKQGGGVVAFSASPTYRGLTDVLVTIIQETKQDPYHGPKLEANLRRWAQNGRCVLLQYGVHSNSNGSLQNAIWLRTKCAIQ